MSSQEYEENYREALRTLRDQGKVVGEPYFAHDGVRGVQVDGIPAIDATVFELAWGTQIAGDIMREKGPSPR